MSFAEIYYKSKQINAEIFVEINNGVIVSEQTGTSKMVQGTRMRPRSDAYHTHLDDYPPSARDMLTGLMCTILYDVKLNGVIGAKKIFRYKFKPALVQQFGRISSGKENNSNLTCNSGDMTDTIIERSRWTESLRNDIIIINNNYIIDHDDNAYIKSLDVLGILMVIEEKRQ